MILLREFIERKRKRKKCWRICGHHHGKKKNMSISPRGGKKRVGAVKLSIRVRKKPPRFPVTWRGKKEERRRHNYLDQIGIARGRGGLNARRTALEEKKRGKKGGTCCRRPVGEKKDRVSFTRWPVWRGEIKGKKRTLKALYRGMRAMEEKRGEEKGLDHESRQISESMPAQAEGGKKRREKRNPRKAHSRRGRRQAGLAFRRGEEEKKGGEKDLRRGK